MDESTYDTDDSSDLLPRPKRMSDSGVSSTENQHDEASSTTHSSAEKKTHALKPLAFLEDVEESEEELESSSSATTYIKIPDEFLPKQDDCDETEKLARKRRCEEIMRLSAKIVAEQKAAASIRPLKWTEPTFSPVSISNMSSAHTDSQEAVSDEPKRRRVSSERMSNVTDR